MVDTRIDFQIGLWLIDGSSTAVCTNSHLIIILDGTVVILSRGDPNVGTVGLCTLGVRVVTPAGDVSIGKSTGVHTLH